MAVEAASKISDLNATLPLFNDPIVEGDDHIRLLKSVIKLDAFSKAETAPQTIVSPMTFNGLVTGNVAFRVESALPYFELRENDTALPGGLFRLQSSAGALTLRANTAPAGDFSTGVNIINYAAGVLNFEAPVAFDALKIEANNPVLKFVEADQAAPAGRYQWSVQGGLIALQKALTGEFTTVENLLHYDPAAGLVFSKTIVAPMRVGNLYVAGMPTGVASNITLSAITGSSLVLRGGVDTNGIVQFWNAAGVEQARIEPAGTAITDAQAVVTLEKGDFRYLQLATGGTLAGSLVAPVGKFGNFYIGADVAGVADTNTIALVGESMNVRVDTGQVITFQVNLAAGARVEAPGTSVPQFYSIITREKGDARYLSLENATSPVVDAVTGSVHIWAINNVEVARIVAGGTAAGSAATVITREKGDARYATLTTSNNTFSVANVFDGLIKASANVEFEYVYSTNTTATAANMTIGSTGPGRLYRSTSSGKFKTARTPIPNPGAIIDALDPLSFQSTHADDEGRRFTGFISEDVAAAFPEASSDNGENYDVRALVAALWAEVRLLRGRLAAVEAA